MIHINVYGSIFVQKLWNFIVLYITYYIIYRGERMSIYSVSVHHCCLYSSAQTNHSVNAPVSTSLSLSPSSPLLSFNAFPQCQDQCQRHPHQAAVTSAGVASVLRLQCHQMLKRIKQMDSSSWNTSHPYRSKQGDGNRKSDTKHSRAKS